MKQTLILRHAGDKPRISAQFKSTQYSIGVMNNTGMATVLRE